MVRGLVIRGFSQFAICLAKKGGNSISNNFIGTDVDGALASPNGTGILIDRLSDDNLIGGNLISGNYGPGVEIRSASRNRVIGNRIGTSFDGNSSLGNLTGVYVIADSQHTIIGGTEVGARNVISGNTGRGVVRPAQDGAQNHQAGHGHQERHRPI